MASAALDRGGAVKGLNSELPLVRPRWKVGPPDPASDATTFSWPTPADVKFVRGDLATMSGYAFDQSGDLSGATSLTDSAIPSVGSGFFYLVRPAGSCRAGSWSSSPGAEPGRDLALP
jgi:hypothetical protein